MTPSLFIKLYAATTLILFTIDLVWLGVVAQQFYRRHLGALMRE